MMSFSSSLWAAKIFMAVSFELDTRLGGRAFLCIEHSGDLGVLKLFIEVCEAVEDGPHVLVGKQSCGGVASVGHFHHAGLRKQGALVFAAGVIGDANSRLPETMSCKLSTRSLVS